jgi:undecaprenyl-diphosphatase
VRLLAVAALLGVVEGLTEFLPVSSTGHLIVAGHLLGYTGWQAAAFEVFIQLGAILAVVWLYRVPLRDAATGLVRGRPEARRLALNLFLGFAPTGLAGLLVHQAVKAHLFNPVSVSIALIVGGIGIWLVEAARPRVRLAGIEAIPPGVALGIGLAQSLSLIPGVSRAAATILGGMVLGLDRRTATVYSFYLAIPTMLAASLFDLAQAWPGLTAEEAAGFLVGFWTAFVAAVASIRFLLRFVATHDFTPFAYYRILLGGAALLYFLSGRG